MVPGKCRGGMKGECSSSTWDVAKTCIITLSGSSHQGWVNSLLEVNLLWKTVLILLRWHMKLISFVF